MSGAPAAAVAPGSAMTTCVSCDSRPALLKVTKRDSSRPERAQKMCAQNMVVSPTS